MREKGLLLFAIMMFVVLAGVFAEEPETVSDENEVAADPFISFIRLTPGMNLPILDSEELFTLNGGGEFSLHHRMENLPFLNLFASVGYSYLPLRDGTTQVSIPSIGVGAGVEFRLLHRFYIEAFVWGGYYHGILHLDKTQAGNLFLHEGVSLGFDVIPMLRIGAGGAFRNHFGLNSDINVFLNASMRFDFHLDDPYVPSSPVLEPLYAELLNYYNSGGPVGVISFFNKGDDQLRRIAVDCTVSGFTDEVRPSFIDENVLEAQSVIEVELLTMYKDKILEFESDRKSETDVNVVFSYKGWKQNHSDTAEFEFYPQIDWEAPAALALFISARDPLMRNYNRAVFSAIDKQTTDEIHGNLRLAAGIYESLRASGFYHTGETAADIELYDLVSSGGLPDYFPFPRTVLNEGSGNDYESAILFCALLESSGVKTGLLWAGERVLPVINLGISPEEARVKYSHSEDLIYQGGVAWIPVDFTAINDGFLASVQKGADIYRSSDNPEMYSVRNLWLTYPQTGFSYRDQEFTLLDSMDITSLFLTEIENLIDWETETWQQQFESRLRSRPSEITTLNNLGVLFSKYGRLDQAVPYFERVLLIEETASTLVNMGNVYFLQDDMRRAYTFYKRAERIDPFNPIVLLGLARVSFELENYGDTQDAYSKLETIDSQLAEEYSILRMKGDDAINEARNSDLHRIVYWLEE